MLLHTSSMLARGGHEGSETRSHSQKDGGQHGNDRTVMEEDFEDATMDACLIAGGQRAEHYEMAAYGTLIAWAQTLGHSDAVSLLRQNLDEEKAADRKLSSLAEGGINRSAAAGEASGAMPMRAGAK